jgi:hypothetical protein
MSKRNWMDGMRGGDRRRDADGSDRDGRVPHASKPKTPPRWPNLGLRYVAYAIGAALFYFLSLGPVMYCFTRVTTTTTAAGPAFTTSVTVEVPGWIGVLYGPAFALYTTQSGDSPYTAYLHWWMERKQARK